MKNKSVKITLITLIVVVLLSVTYVVLAKTGILYDVVPSLNKNQVTTYTEDGNNDRMMSRSKAQINDAINEAVTKGIITKEKADELITYIDKNTSQAPPQSGNRQGQNRENNQGNNNRPSGNGPNNRMAGSGQLSGAVKENIITQQQADEINNILTSKFQESRDKLTESAVANLVNKGVITQAQSEKVLNTIKSYNAARFSGQGKTSPSTDNNSEEIGIFDGLVKDGVITKEQAAEISKVIQMGRNNNMQSRTPKQD